VSRVLRFAPENKKAKRLKDRRGENLSLSHLVSSPKTEVTTINKRKEKKSVHLPVAGLRGSKSEHGEGEKSSIEAQERRSAPKLRNLKTGKSFTVRFKKWGGRGKRHGRRGNIRNLRLERFSHEDEKRNLTVQGLKTNFCNRNA